jgi:hypothetical protein
VGRCAAHGSMGLESAEATGRIVIGTSAADDDEILSGAKAEIEMENLAGGRG